MQVLNRSLEPKAAVSPDANVAYPMQTYDPSSVILQDFSTQGLLMPQLGTAGPQGQFMTLQSSLAPVLLPQQIVSPTPGSASQRDCVRLRGLPVDASVTDIVAFLADFARNVVFQGIHMVLTPQVSTLILASVLRDVIK